MNEQSTTAVAVVTIKDALCRLSRRNTLRVEHFDLRAGQHWCLFGGNGAGKSVLAKLISGKLGSGHQHVCFAPDFDPHKELVIVSFEEQQRLWQLDNRHDISEYSDNALDSGTTVENLIRDGALPEPRHEARLQELMTALELTALSGRGIRYLSSGQLRKAMIAKALFSCTQDRLKLLILDDPLESIDRDSRQQIADLISRCMDTQTCTLLLCRRKSEILPGITHLAVMNELQILEQGTMSNVIEGEAFNSVTGRRFSSIPQLPTALAKNPSYENGQVLIALRNVSVFYQQQRVLHAINWTMHYGQHTLIEGPNGCGKSTLLNLLCGENHKAYGQDVTLFGNRRGSGESVWQIKSHFGIVSNELQNKYVKGWKVLDVVLSGFFDSVGLYDRSGASQIDLAKQWLGVLSLETLARDYYHEISFGQQRLVLLARAMVKAPDILILDEPCVGLDDYFRFAILQIIDVIAANSGTQILYVSHTSNEEPGCIQERLHFVAAREGGYTLLPKNNNQPRI